MKFRHFVILVFLIIVGAGVLLVQVIDFKPYIRSEISTYTYWKQNPTLKMVQQSITNGQDVNGYSEYGWTPVMFAIQTGDTEIVTALVRAGADVNVRAKDSSTPLIQAVITATTPDMIETLLRLGADITTQDKHGRTAHEYALENPDLQHTKIINALTP